MPISKYHRPYDSTYIMFSNDKNVENNNTFVVVSTVGEEWSVIF
jgi:hypothetical protein